MPNLTIPTFRGMTPKRAPHFLREDQSVLADNCFFDYGTLKPFSDVALYQENVITVDAKSMYEYRGGASPLWYSWTYDVDVISSPIGNDAFERIYFTGWADNTDPDGPHYIDNTGAEFRLGVAEPQGSLFVEVIGQGDDGDDITEVNDDETWFYVYTYVTTKGEEGPPSAPSESVTITKPWNPPAVGQYVKVTVPAIGAGVGDVTDRDIVTRRLYRFASDASDLLLVAEFTDPNVGEIEFDDKVKTLDLGTALLSEFHYPPPLALKGLAAMPNGISTGFENNVVYFSEPSLPYAWNPNNIVITDSPVTGIAPLSSGGVVVTEGKPYILQGYTPDSMQLSKLDVPYGCVHKNSIVDLGESVIYVSDAGLIGVSSNGVEVLTQDIFEKSQWEQFIQGEIKSFRWMDNYVMMWSNADSSKTGTLIFNVRAGDVAVLPMYYECIYQPEGTDFVYFAVDGDTSDGKIDVHELLEGAGTGKVTWKSKEYHTPPMSFNCVQLKVLEGEGKVIYYRDGINVFEGVTQEYNKIFRLPSGQGRKHQIQLESIGGTIEQVAISTSVQELLSG